MQKSQREIGLDVIRILAGIGVVLIHVTDPFLVYPPYQGIGGTSWWVLNIINTLFRTSVPLFVIISGLLLLDTSKKLDAATFYKRRFAKVGIPSLLWIVLYVIILVLMGQITSVSVLFQRLLTMNIIHLYFIFLILELYLVTPLFHTFLTSYGKKAIHYLLIGTFLITTVISTTNLLFPKDAIHLTRNIATIFIPFLFYYLLGPYLKNIRLSLSSVISIGIIYLYMSIFIAIISKGYVTAYSRKYDSIPIIIMSIMSFAALYQTNYLKLLRHPVIEKTIVLISSLTFGMYLVHMLVIFAADYVTPLIPEKMTEPVWYIVFGKFLGVLLISYAVSWLLRKLPFSKYVVA